MSGTGQELDVGHRDYPQPSEEIDPFAGTKAQAEGVMRRLRRLTVRLAENQTTHDTLVAESGEWLARVNGDLNRAAGDATRWLVSWMAARLDHDPGAPKTEELPSGVIRSRAGATRVEVSDPDIFLSWATANAPGLVRTYQAPPPPPPVPDKAAIRAELGKLLAASIPGAHGFHGPLIVVSSGELVPGVTLVRDDRHVTIEPRLSVR